MTSEFCVKSTRGSRGGRSAASSVMTSEFPPGPGGIGTHAHEVALGLQRLGWEVLVLASQDYASAEDVAGFNGAQPFRVVRFRRIPGPPVRGRLPGSRAGTRVFGPSHRTFYWRPAAAR